jgi:hypothetical protein
MKSSLIAAIVIGLAGSVAHAAPTRQQYVQLNCHGGECYWSAIQTEIMIRQTAHGTLIGAMTSYCVTTHEDSNYPDHHTCRASDEPTSRQYVAFCSRRYPSIAVKNDDDQKWIRTRLSISEDAERGFNLSSIKQYLIVCHDYVRGSESLDMIGAKFGYRSRHLPEEPQDTVNSIDDLVE